LEVDRGKLTPLKSKSPVIHEPPPIPNDNPHIADLVIQDIQEKKKMGIEKYGVPLQAGNGRNALVDAYQEALDMGQYLRQEIEEKVALESKLAEIHSQVRLAKFYYKYAHVVENPHIDEALELLESL